LRATTGLPRTCPKRGFLLGEDFYCYDSNLRVKTANIREFYEKRAIFTGMAGRALCQRRQRDELSGNHLRMINGEIE
jgi:hypothetical protein